MGAATIRDVARKAGVSVATVSRVVNGQAVVGEETRRRVLSAINDLEYTPNGLARGLARQSSRTLGVIVPDIANPYFGEVARGMGDAAEEEGYLLMLANVEQDSAKEIAYINLFSEQQVDGLIYTSGPVTAELGEGFRRLNRPVVLASTWDPAERWPAVLVDSYQGARLAMEHLLELNHRRIAVVSGSFSDPVSGLPRWKGYRDAARERGVEIPPAYIIEAGFSREAAYDGVRRVLQLPEPPTAVVCASDLMAIAAMSAAHDAGLTVPRDLSVVGFDDIALASGVRPRLTTVAQPMYEIGAIAMKRLAQVMAGDTSSPRVEWIAPRLIQRESTARI